MKPVRRRLLVLASWLLVALALGAPAAQAQPADPPPSSFRSEAPAAASGKRTVEQALDACIVDVERLEKDAVGVPYLAAAYIAFFVILLGFFLIVRVRQRRLELEMDELRLRLARLQGGEP